MVIGDVSSNNFFIALNDATGISNPYHHNNTEAPVSPVTFHHRFHLGNPSSGAARYRSGRFPVSECIVR
jgi:hypothetical protein